MNAHTENISSVNLHVLGKEYKRMNVYLYSYIKRHVDVLIC